MHSLANLSCKGRPMDIADRCHTINRCFVFFSLVVERQDGGSLMVRSENRKIVVSYSPFRVDFMIDSTAVVTLNAQGLLEFEHYRERR